MLVPSRLTPDRQISTSDPALGHWARNRVSSMLAIISILLTAAFVYASLVPLAFAVPDYHVRLSQIITSFPLQWGEAFDWGVNLLALIPLGFCWSGALDSRTVTASLANTCATAARFQDRRSPQQTFGRVALGCLLLAALAETVQVWLPLRVPSLRDLVALETGALLGCGVWWFLGARTTLICCRTLRAFAMARGRRPCGLLWFQLFGCLLAVCLTLNTWATPSQWFQMYRHRTANHRTLSAESLHSAWEPGSVLLTGTVTALVLSGLCAGCVRALERTRRTQRRPADGLRIFLPETSSAPGWSVVQPQHTPETAADATGKRAA